MAKIKAKPTQKEVFLEQTRASIKATATEGEGIQLRIPITEISSGWAYDKNGSTLSLCLSSPGLSGMCNCAFLKH